LLAFVAGAGKSNPRRLQNLRIKPTLFLLVITTFFLLEYGITNIRSTRSRSRTNIYMVHAFDIHQSRGRHYPPPRSTTATEPYTQTIFPKTSTPADLEDQENDGMFSPMHQNEKRKKKKRKQKNTQPQVKSIWDTSAPVLVQASSLKTFNFETPTVERVQILLKKADMVDRSGRRIPNQEPLIARVDLWHGPDSTPQNLAIYHDDVDDDDEFDELHSADCDYKDDEENENHAASYSDTPFSTIIETPQGHNTIAIRNIADSSDLMACVEGEKNTRLEEEYWSGRSSTTASRNQNGSDGSNTSNDSPLQSVIQRLQATTTPQRIDSSISSRGSVTDASDDDVNDEDKPSAVVGSIAVELPDNIASVQVLLQTEYMRPLQARIELELRMIEEDGNYRVVKRTIVEVYSEDGMHRPFFAVLETPRKNNRKTKRRGQKGKGNAVYSTSMCVVNLSSAEFPLFATVEPHLIDPFRSDEEEEEDDIMNSRGKNPVEEDEDEGASGHQRFTHFGGGSSSILDAEVL
jgi:hypothetical protein